MIKGVTNLSNLMETRRLIRTIRVNSDRRKTELNSAINGLDKKKKDVEEKLRRVAYNILCESNSNIKQIKHMDTLLKTHLAEKTNLNNKLQRQTQMLLNENEELQERSQIILEDLATKFDHPVTVIMSDIVKRLNKELSASSRILVDADNEPYGVLTMNSIHSTQTLYCIVLSQDMSNSFKTFLNELPVEFTVKNFTPFISPSQLHKMLKALLAEDGILPK